MKKIIFVFIITLCFTACSDYNLEKQVEEEFLSENSDKIIESIVPVEGDGEFVYFEIQFSDVNTKSSDKVIYQYKKINDTWVSEGKK